MNRHKEVRIQIDCKDPSTNIQINVIKCPSFPSITVLPKEPNFRENGKWALSNSNRNRTRKQSINVHVGTKFELRVNNKRKPIPVELNEEKKDSSRSNTAKALRGATDPMAVNMVCSISGCRLYMTMLLKFKICTKKGERANRGLDLSSLVSSQSRSLVSK